MVIETIRHNNRPKDSIILFFMVPAYFLTLKRSAAYRRPRPRASGPAGGSHGAAVVELIELGDLAILHRPDMGHQGSVGLAGGLVD